ncbi:MAG: glycoside hydrolase family 26 protein [Reinekea forsetii]|jgi:mannan endo-1,4-beta-mannosidase|uniref:Endo-beta-1,4-mannanase, CBM10 (3x), GH26 family n=1 Tax=Reinekea forsetii TaxID=1336806 RepID=A0A2K8KN09_9GAMM|nr:MULTISPECIES: glycosyl hydrolase [Reinekea]ATX76220.1 endo-beta-1,4-mannanase, CBM10 (3x), GH26 family [Reinekea forsetii]MDO7642491.1 glycoside hydrolase family 26 protein [Reinekea forsetii]MDO7673358.1 glycoside hydrolase family 26 protein [Reinekea forsetii]
MDVFRSIIQATLLVSCALGATANAQSYPDCSNGTALDGTGYGWQNNQSCFRYPDCSNASADPDGDGWGWQDANVCVMHHSCSAQSADPDGDGWGWEDNTTCSANSSGAASGLANGSANQTTQDIYRYLQNLPNKSTNRVLSGAFGGYSGISGGSAFSLAESDKIKAWTGQRPAIYACDYARGWDRANRVADLINYDCNATLKNLFNNQGGLVQISNHLPSPIPTNGGGLKNPIANWQYAKIFQQGHDIRKRWFQILNKVADGLEDLQNSGVTVIYRPLHEMTGEWFWWGASGYNTNDAVRHALYKRLWIEMYHYFTQDRGLNNLIWVYSPDANRDYKMSFYPGDDYVDVVGLDAYNLSIWDAKVQRGYDELSEVNKPFVFAEIGPSQAVFDAHGKYDFEQFINALHSNFPKTSYFIPWNDAWSPTANANAWSLYNDPWTVNLGELAY